MVFGAGSVVGLMYLIKALRGEKPTKVEEKDGDLHVTDMSGGTLITSKKPINWLKAS